MSVDFEATDWLALAHGPIVDIMITYGVLRAVVRLKDRRGRGTNPHLIAIYSAEAYPPDRNFYASADQFFMHLIFYSYE